ncbi:MAG: hypothetical protein L0H63_14575, partial [Nitrococcus sp.]|nr:hypothetical protein [Nitrococcus sp.]
VGGFGDLVVLINPALEAMEFSALSDMSTERGTYFPSQLPVMLEMTSEADYATRYAFPAGRWLSTLFEETREQTRLNKVTDKQESISESDANITAIGHFKPYRTHRLYPVESQIAAQSNELNTRDATAYSVRLFRKTCRDWRHDKPGSQTEFGALMLERTITSAGRNPYLFAYVDKRLISGHNDIDDPRIIEFIKQVILISTQPAASGCASRPNSKYVPPNREDSAVGRTGRRAG